MPAELGVCGAVDGALHDGGDDRDGVRLPAAHPHLGVLSAHLGRDEEWWADAGHVPQENGERGWFEDVVVLNVGFERFQNEEDVMTEEQCIGEYEDEDVRNERSKIFRLTTQEQPGQAQPVVLVKVS